MIESQFHPCDEMTRFGFTAHGVATGIQTGTRQLIVGSETFPLPFNWPFQSGEISEPYDTHLLRVPGLAPPELPPEEIAAEAAVGRTWQHYALLSEDRFVLFGQVLAGWVCIDPAGERWLIRTTPHINRSIVLADQPLTLSVSAVPFGHLDEPAATPVVQSITLADLGQGSGQPPPSANANPQALMLRVGSVSSHGRQVVIELHGVESLAVAATRRINTAPAGFLLLELTGDGPDFDLSLSVLRTRTQVLGTYTQNRAAPPRCTLRSEWSTTSTPNGGGADVVATLTGATTVLGSFSTDPLWGSGWIGGTRTDRVAALVFDDQDELVEFTYDASLRVEYSYPDFSVVEVSGAVSGWIADSAQSTTTNVTSTISGEVRRSSTEHLVGEVVIRRDGGEVAAGRFTVDSVTDEWTVISPGSAPELFRRDGQVIGSMAITHHHTLGETWVVDDGPGEVSWDYPHPGDWGSNTGGHALWGGMTATPSTPPYGYGASIDYGNTVTNPYSGAAMALQRYSNNVFGVSVRAKAGTLPNRWRVPALAAPQAVWSNPAAADATGSRGATYQPYTHQIFTDASDGDVTRPFVWV
ncbi:hypothetical protein D9M68_254100 [compost metagenome]